MKKIYCIFVIISVTLNSFSQEYYDDAQIRGHFSLEKKFNKKWSAQLDQQYRFTQNASDFSRIAINPGVGYRITKDIRLQADYTLIQNKNKEDLFSLRHWYSLSAIFKYDKRRFKFQYRNMTQVRNSSRESKWAYVTRIFNRNKFSLKYEATKRFTPYFASELYIPLNSPNYIGIERIRGFSGLLINTFRNQQLELYFMYQQQLHKNLWYKNNDNDMRLRRHYIYGIGYSIVF
jgi:hypothetical protein